MNNIPVIQNEPLQIERLAAQRYRYSCSKSLLWVQLIVSVPIAVGWSFLVMGSPEMKGWASAWGICATGLLFLMENSQKSWQEMAAKIQELFDCEVLELPWNSVTAGSRPPPEDVHENATKYFQRAKTAPPLDNWYPQMV